MLVDNSYRGFESSRGFLVVDGVNGAGKGTLLAKLVPYLESKGRRVVLTREPGGTALGTHIRAMLLEEKAGKVAALAEALLFAADRAQHVAEKIRPVLDSGALLVSDRYYYSSVAFQGYGRELGPQKILDINLEAIDGMRPDLVLLLDLSPEEGLRRTRKRADAQSKGGAVERDTFEQEALSFHARLRAGFLEMANSYPEPFFKVDASRAPEEVFTSVLPIVNQWLSSIHS